jgi:hypothetical protein
VLHLEKLATRWYALRAEGRFAGLLDQGRKIRARWLVADRTVRLSTDEGEVGDVVRFARGVGMLEHGLGEDVMKLQPVLSARVIQGNRKIRTPVLGPAGSEGKEHGLEQSAPLVVPFQLRRCDVQAPDLEPYAVDQFLCATTIAEGRKILVEDGFARPPGEAPLGVRH